MKRLFVLCLSLLFSLSLAFADEGGYEILDYKVHGTLNINNTIDVVEEISVNFLEERHGIYRYIPCSIYIEREGTNQTYKSFVRNIDVEGFKHQEKTEGDNVIIQIGDENKLVEGGQLYVISYTIIIPDDRVSSSDFLFHSVLGDDWDVNIHHFEFQIDFEKALPSDTYIQTISGKFGGTENALNVISQQSPNYIRGETDNIPPKNAITLFAELPEDYFENPYKPSGIFSWICSVLTIITCAFILFKALFIKHKTVVSTVEFYPPDGISSAEVGYIIDSSADLSDLLSLIPEWGNKGYVKLEETETKGKKVKLSLTKLKDLPENAPSYQKETFNAFFRKGDVCDLTNLSKSDAEKINDSCSDLADVFEGERELYKNEFIPSLLVILVSALFYLAGATSSVHGASDNLGCIYGPIILLFLGFKLETGRKKKGFMSNKNKVLNIILSAIGLTLNFLITMFFFSTECILPKTFVIFLTLLVSLTILFVPRLLQKTEYATEITGKLMGLREFIKTAEVPRLEVLIKENPNYYFDLLPYAMVFGLANQWAKKWESIHLEQPDWYNSSNTLFNTMYLNKMFSEKVTTPINATTQEAKKSAASSSHGGYSGGGSGGGGGGSW
ncbi:MAG: DUF2207 domain-containing protein [Treponema sp.]|nr:DUF2207 domain-containing protein [Treponema sp.]